MTLFCIGTVLPSDIMCTRDRLAALDRMVNRACLTDFLRVNVLLRAMCETSMMLVGKEAKRIAQGLKEGERDKMERRRNLEKRVREGVDPLTAPNGSIGIFVLRVLCRTTAVTVGCLESLHKIIIAYPPDPMFIPSLFSPEITFLLAMCLVDEASAYAAGIYIGLYRGKRELLEAANRTGFSERVSLSYS
jgi:hypothetical protein